MEEIDPAIKIIDDCLVNILVETSGNLIVIDNGDEIVTQLQIIKDELNGRENRI